MKKYLSLALAGVMVFSALPVAYAADYTAGTQVEYVAADQTAYTITVPALLNPGQSGDVTLSGTWASDCTVKVTADATVELTNSINSNDKKVLNIGFVGIEKAGDNTEAKSYTEAVSVAAMPSDALFGTWSGKFNYNVEFDQAAPSIAFKADTSYSPVAHTATINVEKEMVAGETYIVEFDGVEYTLVAREVTGIWAGVDQTWVVLGNCQLLSGKLFGQNVVVNGEATEEPFLITNDKDEYTERLTVYAANDAATHKVRITKQ